MIWSENETREYNRRLLDKWNAENAARPLGEHAAPPSLLALPYERSPTMPSHHGQFEENSLVAGVQFAFGVLMILVGLFGLPWLASWPIYWAISWIAGW